ncbi:arylsulfatase B-like [Glandiceps talaboti]
MIGDDMGWNDVSWHDKNMVTPNLESLAEDGVKLDNFYTMAACSPSRVALMTGMYSSNVGGQHYTYLGHLPHGAPTYLPFLPKKLKDLGYSTYGVGKWHLGFCNESYIPGGPNRGFDHYFGFYQGGATYYEHVNNENGPGFNGRYVGYDLHDDGKNVGVHAACQYTSVLFEEKVLTNIEEHDPSEPMFHYVAFQLPHSPRVVPKQWELIYNWIENDHRRIYCAQVTYMDAIVGNIVSKLKEKGMYEDTLFVFHADNGGDVMTKAANWPYRGDKGTYFDGGIRGVGFISGAGIKETGYTHEGMFHITDMYPTLIKGMLGGEVADNLDGIDQWVPMSENEPSNRNGFLITVDTDMAHLPRDNVLGANVTAIRFGDWKLMIGFPAFSYTYNEWDWYPPAYTNDVEPIEHIDSEETDIWLFNLAEDPLEKDNVAEQFPEKVAELRELLKPYEATAWNFWPEEDPACDPALHGEFWSTGWC